MFEHLLSNSLFLFLINFISFFLSVSKSAFCSINFADENLDYNYLNYIFLILTVVNDFWFLLLFFTFPCDDENNNLFCFLLTESIGTLQLEYFVNFKFGFDSDLCMVFIF